MVRVDIYRRARRRSFSQFTRYWLELSEGATMAALRSLSLSSLSSFCVRVVLVFFFVLNVAVLIKCGQTSSFVRKVEKTVDMPLDSDVFQIPPGYNAPQQVF